MAAKKKTAVGIDTRLTRCAEISRRCRQISRVWRAMSA